MRGRGIGGLALALGVIVALTPAARTAETLPPITGELGGEITPLKIPGTPRLNWKLNLTGGDAVTRRADLHVDGPGTALVAKVELDRAANAKWKIESATLDVAVWFAAVAAQMPADWRETKLEGALQLSGEGTWINGEFAGAGRVTLRQGRLDDAKHKLVLEGIALDVAFTDLALVHTRPNQVLSWTGGRFDEVEIGAGRIAFAATGDTVSVNQAVIGLLGGELQFDAFTFSLAKGELAVDARVVGIEVARLLPLLPPVLAEAHGRLNGTLLIRRDATGVQLDAGHLALQPGQSAQLRLEPTPGLLSQSLPSTVLKYYPGLGQIETGEIPISASLLEVSFSPAGDADGRTAYVHLAGGPVDPRLRAPIDLEVNVRGPLESLIKLGTSGRLRFGGKP